jgi:hypothetical protein
LGLGTLTFDLDLAGITGISSHLGRHNDNDLSLRRMDTRLLHVDLQVLCLFAHSRNDHGDGQGLARKSKHVSGKLEKFYHHLTMSLK